MSVVQLSTLFLFAVMQDIKIKFGNRIKELRLSQGYSQEQLAELSELDRTYIPGIEAGKRNVSLVVIEKLANAFKISLAEIMTNI